MDDLSKFERQVANEVVGSVRPPRSVDAMAIVRAAASPSPRWRFRSEFKAARFIVAGVIVALFGSLLLAGLLTQPSEEQAPFVGASPSASTDALPATDAATNYAAVRSQLVTENVRPGVARVVRDGAGYEFVDGLPHRVSIAPDGSVWVLGSSQIVQLGEPGSQQSGSPDPDFEWTGDVEFGPDGTIWALASSGLWRWPDGEFAAPVWAGKPLESMAVLPNGTVWASGNGALVRLDGDGWTDLPDVDAPIDLPPGAALGGADHLVATLGGELWTVADIQVGSDPEGHALLRYDGDSWERMEPLGPGQSFLIDALAAGSDGTLWAALRACDDCSWFGSEPKLASFDGSDWTVLGAEDGLRFVSAPMEWMGTMGASGDGIVMATQDSFDTEIDLAMFDSSGLLATLSSRELDGLVGSDFVDTIAPAPDGSFWVTIWDNDDGGVLIVDPDSLVVDDTTTTPDLLPDVDE